MDDALQLALDLAVRGVAIDANEGRVKPLDDVLAGIDCAEPTTEGLGLRRAISVAPQNPLAIVPEVIVMPIQAADQDAGLGSAGELNLVARRSARSPTNQSHSSRPTLAAQ